MVKNQDANDNLGACIPMPSKLIRILQIPVASD